MQGKGECNRQAPIRSMLAFDYFCKNNSNSVNDWKPAGSPHIKTPAGPHIDRFSRIGLLKAHAAAADASAGKETASTQDSSRHESEAQLPRDQSALYTLEEALIGYHRETKIPAQDVERFNNLYAPLPADTEHIAGVIVELLGAESKAGE